MRVPRLGPLLVYDLVALALIAWRWRQLLTGPALLAAIAPWHFEWAEKKWFFAHLLEGELAWIYPATDLGHSLATNPASGLLFLPGWVLALLPPGLWHLLSVGAFSFLSYRGTRYLLSLFSTELAAAQVAVATLSFGIFTSLMEHSALGYISLLPWAIAHWVTLSRRLPSMLVTAFSTAALFLLGDPLLCPVAMAAGLALRPRRPALPPVVIVVALTTAMASPHLWAMWQDAGLNARSLGIPSYEALSYSTSPWRLLDVLTPWKLWYQFAEVRGDGFHRQWWFQSLGGGVCVCALLLWGLARRHRYTLVSWAFLVLLGGLALGQFFALSAWVFSSLPPFTWVRYPERFLAYALPFVALALLARWPRAHRWSGPLALAVVVLENLFSAHSLPVIPLRELHTSLPRETIVGTQVMPARYLLCEDPSAPVDGPSYLDVRGFGLAMVNGTSNSRPAGLKVVSCPGALSDHAQRWLGWTHALVLRPDVIARPERCLVEGRLAVGELWSCPSAGPLTARWVTRGAQGPFIERLPPSATELQRLQALSEGTDFFTHSPPVHAGAQGPITLSATPSGQGFLLQWNSADAGVIALPWRFHHRWKSRPELPTLRLNDSTLGVRVPPQLGELRIEYTDPLLNGLLGLSLLLQGLCLGSLLALIFGRYVPIVRRDRSPKVL